MQRGRIYLVAFIDEGWLILQNFIVGSDQLAFRV
jgi:hypothetical protein